MRFSTLGNFRITARRPGEWMNRLYCVESQYSVTGSAADFRLALQSSQIAILLKKIEDAIDAGIVVEDKVEAGDLRQAQGG